MGIIGQELGEQIKNELAAAGEPITEPTPEPVPPSKDHDGAHEVSDDILGDEPQGDEPEAAAPAEHTKYTGEDDAGLDEVLEFGEIKATIRELFEARKSQFDPKHLNEMIQGVQQDKARYSQAAEQLGELASLRKQPHQFYVKAAEQFERDGIMPAGSADAMRAWFQELAQSGAIDPAKLDHAALQEQHARTLADKDGEYAGQIANLEAQRDMIAIKSRYGQLSEKDITALKDAVATKIAEGKGDVDRIVARTFKELIDSKKIVPVKVARAAPSERKIADQTRRLATDRRSSPNKKDEPPTDDELDLMVNQSLQKLR